MMNQLSAFFPPEMKSRNINKYQVTRQNTLPKHKSQKVIFSSIFNFSKVSAIIITVISGCVPSLTSLQLVAVSPTSQVTIAAAKSTLVWVAIRATWKKSLDASITNKGAYQHGSHMLSKQVKMLFWYMLQLCDFFSWIGRGRWVLLMCQWWGWW